jgi:hypothetical protein
MNNYTIWDFETQSYTWHTSFPQEHTMISNNDIILLMID